NYREVAAEVERIDEVCVPLRASVSEATDCATASARAGGKRLRHYRAVRVRYTSPADGQMHSGVVIPTGGDKAVEASQLRPGDRWTIMAHDDKAEVIKAD
ncbi:MAG TPA: hypothetical protein VM076_19200, partial [Gemmatimonadaceae bacterium]|nr:hypothetical protein [Gemmatimonadaceae bacterium]